MQLRKSGDSPLPSASVNFPPQLSSSQSPPITSTNQTLGLLQQSTVTIEKVPCPTPPSCSTSCPDRASPTSIGQNHKCPTPISYQSPVFSQKNINHTLSLKKSQNQLEGQINLPKTKITPQCSTTNCQSHQATTLAFRPKSPTPLCSLVSNCLTPSVVTARSKQIAHYPPSIVSWTPKISPSQQNTNWNEQLSMEESPGPGSQEISSVSINCDPPELQKSYCLPTIVPNPISSYKLQSQPSQRKQLCSIVVQSTGQEPVVFSTHCSQAITSPISSPIILENHETSVQVTKISQSGDNSCIIKATSWNQANETSPPSNCNVVPSQNSSST